MNLGSMNLGSMNFGPRERIFVGLGTAPPPRLQATKATQMMTMLFVGYLRPGIVGGPHSNRNNVP